MIVNNLVVCDIAADRYINFINAIKKVNTYRNFENLYSEIHHIIPRCLGGKDEESNYIKLTLREHYIAHLLLYKIYKTYNLLYTILMMGSLQTTFNSRLYEKYKIEYKNKSEGLIPVKDVLTGKRLRVHKTDENYLNGRYVHNSVGQKRSKETIDKFKDINYKENNPFYGKKHTEETKQKISDALKGKSTKKHTEETKKKISEANSGENNYMYGKTHTNETKQKISDALKGKTSKKHTEETKQKISESQLGSKNHMYGKKASEETKQKISNSLKGKKLSKDCKRVLIANIDNIEYTVSEAAEKYNIKLSAVRSRCNSKKWKNWTFKK